MSSENLVKLVNLWSEFEKSNPEGEIEAFCRYYLMQQNLDPSGRVVPSSFIQGKLGRMLGRLYKFSLFYSKKALGSIKINNLENFIYLASIEELGTPGKSELIRHCLSEFTSGIGIITRLLNKKWITEYNYKEDARVRKVKLTPKGEKVLYESYPEMAKIGIMVFCAFSEEEMQLFWQLGKKLDDIHTDIYPDAKDKSMEQLLDMVGANAKIAVKQNSTKKSTKKKPGRK